MEHSIGPLMRQLEDVVLARRPDGDLGDVDAEWLIDDVDGLRSELCWGASVTTTVLPSRRDIARSLPRGPTPTINFDIDIETADRLGSAS